MRGVPTRGTKYFIAFIWVSLWDKVDVLKQQNIVPMSRPVEVIGPGPPLLPPFCCCLCWWRIACRGGQARDPAFHVPWHDSHTHVHTHTLLLHFWWWAHSAWAESSYVWGIHHLLSFAFAAQTTKSSKFQCRGSSFPTHFPSIPPR